MKKLLLAVATLSVLAASVAAASAHCYPVCRPVPNGSGGFVTVCTCG